MLRFYCHMVRGGGIFLLYQQLKANLTGLDK